MAEVARKLFDEGPDGIQAAIAAADTPGRRVARVAGEFDPPLGMEFTGVPAGEWQPDDTGLPEDCPVLPLGVNGNEFWFLDTLGQLTCILRNEFSQNTINALFMGRHLYLSWMRPQRNKAGDVVGWKANQVREDLMRACGLKGPWTPSERTRGRGAWLRRDGGLIIHSGIRLWSLDGHMPLGEIDGFVYMTRPPLVEPWPASLEGKRGPACVIWPLLKRWNWERPDIDPLLFLGWLGAASIGGALPWRPVVYITGDYGQGKSTLQDLSKAILGEMLVQAVDATAASVYQRFKMDALPVAIDEIEGEAEGRRGEQMIKMARAAASGGDISRGGDRGTPSDFKARSCFMFSSINTPPLEPADRSRMAMLHLKRLTKGAAEPYLDRARLGRCGQAIMRKIIDNWGRYGETWRQYAEMLADVGHIGRGQKVFGTLMALADLIIDTDADELGIKVGNGTESLSCWHEHFRVDQMHEFEGQEENWRQALNHLITAPVDAWRGDHKSGRTLQTVSELLALYRQGDLMFGDTKALLIKTGLNLIAPTQIGQGEDRLFVPNQHQQVGRLYQGSKWFGRAGAGVWAGAFRQAPYEARSPDNRHIGAWRGRGFSFPLSVIFSEEAPIHPGPAQAAFDPFDLPPGALQ